MAAKMIDAGHGGYDNGASYEDALKNGLTSTLHLHSEMNWKAGATDQWEAIPEPQCTIHAAKARIEMKEGPDSSYPFTGNSSPRPEYNGVQTLV